jgi:hypothetical protein
MTYLDYLYFYDELDRMYVAYLISKQEYDRPLTVLQLDFFR